MLRHLIRPAAIARPLIGQTLNRGLATQPQRKQKVSTGLVGIPVDPEARSKLITLYKQTLVEADKLKVDIKEDIVAITKSRLSVCEKIDDPEKIEEEIRCGQIEELVIKANDELKLVRWLNENTVEKKFTKKEKELAMLTTGESTPSS